MLLVERSQFFSKHDTFETRSKVEDSLLKTQASTNFDFHDILNDERSTNYEENESFNASRSLIKLDVNWCVWIMRRLISFIQSSRSIVEERKKRKRHARDSVDSVFDRKRSRIRTFSSNREQKSTNSKKRNVNSSISNVCSNILLSLSTTRIRNLTID
jgi:hypothetical protein